MTYIVFVFVLFASLFSNALLEVIVLKEIRDSIPLAVLPFYVNQTNQASGIGEIVAQDLSRSGQFHSIPIALTNGQTENYNAVNFDKWQKNQTEILVFGDVIDDGGNFLTVSVYAYEIFSRQNIFAYRYRASKNAKRRISHQISDKIYQMVLGIKGDFDTYLTYVSVAKDSIGKPSYHLKISDIDGANDRVLLSSSEPLLSPSWSPDNNRIAYVSFENGRSEVFVRYPFLRRKTQKLPSFDGIVNAPSWHPLSNKLLLTMSKNGNKDIYLYHFDNEYLERITYDEAIDTEASFSPNGKSIVFTSNRSGRAQIYLKDLTNNHIKRISFKGLYNVSARFSPDGKQLVLLNGRNNKYHIVLFDLNSNESTRMTESILDESPGFSPNGENIIYAGNFGKKSVLSILSIDGSRAHQLISSSEQIRDPDWSNFLTQ